MKPAAAGAGPGEAASCGEAIATRLQHWALERPDDVAVALVSPSGDEAGRLTSAELHRDALRIAGALRHRGVGGDPVLILARSDLDFARSLFGCFYAGAIAAPSPPPAPGARLNRLQAIAAHSGARFGLGRISRAISTPTPIDWVDPAAPGGAPLESAIAADPQTPAVLQYTSGSTDEPRGVVLAHRNLAANADMVRVAFGIGPQSRFLSWLPMFHDMGLMALLASVAGRIPIGLMDPSIILHRPLRWLGAIGDWGATISGGPNFAFEACRTAALRQPVPQVHLECWTTAFCGAEPVRTSTLEGFASAFAASGFSREALFPCYGLAEATVFVAGRYMAPGRRSDGRVSCGWPAAGTRLRIVHPETRLPLPDGEAGEVCVTGDHVGAGYWRRPDASAASFVADAEGEVWLQTGDLGAIEADGLVIRGRLKDVLIVRGVNIDPTDVEVTLAAALPLVLGRTAVFSLETERGSAVVAVQEIRSKPPPDGLEDLTSAALAAIAAVHGLRLYDLVFVAQGVLPHTSSGKVRRSEARKQYEAGGFKRTIDNSGHVSLGKHIALNSFVEPTSISR